MEGVLDQVALSTGLQGAEDVHIALVCRQHDDSCLRELRPNGDERVEAIHLRHLNVHQRHIRAVHAELLDRFSTIRRFGDHGHIRLNFHQTGDPLAHEWMVIDRENPNRRAASLKTHLLRCTAGGRTVRQKQQRSRAKRSVGRRRIETLAACRSSRTRRPGGSAWRVIISTVSRRMAADSTDTNDSYPNQPYPTLFRVTSGCPAPSRP